MEGMVEIRASVKTMGHVVIASCDQCDQFGIGTNEFEAVSILKSNINRMYGWIFPMDNINL
jgi:hypothetical protein